MDLNLPYAFGKKVSATFESTEQRVREALAREGFGILTEIDVKEKFREKLGRDFRKYLILGACNPSLAWEAFGMEPNIGTLLPCNVVVYEDDDTGTVVMVMDPVAALAMIGNPALNELAGMVRKKMEQVLEAV